jgi:hypothetical protein
MATLIKVNEALYEVTLQGFNGDTCATDNLIMWIHGTPASIWDAFGNLGGLIRDISVHALPHAFGCGDVNVSNIGLKKAHIAIREYVVKAYDGLKGKTITSYRDQAHLAAIQDKRVEADFTSSFSKLLIDSDVSTFMVIENDKKTSIAAFNSLFI